MIATCPSGTINCFRALSQLRHADVSQHTLHAATETARILTLQGSFSTSQADEGKAKSRTTTSLEELFSLRGQRGTKPAWQARQVGRMLEAHMTRLSPKAGCNRPAQVFVRRIP